MRSRFQLTTAGVLGGLFGAVQIIVLVSVIGHAMLEGICGITTILTISMAGIFLLCAVLHPQEISNLAHVLIYFLVVPLIYNILFVYSVCNMDLVTWGTREVTETKAGKEKLEEKELKAAAKKIQSNPDELEGPTAQSVLSMPTEDGGLVECGSCCLCLCCPRPGKTPTDTKVHNAARSSAKRFIQIKGDLMEYYDIKPPQPPGK